MHGSASDGGTLAHTYRPVKVSVENRWNSGGKHGGGTKNKHGVVSYLDAAPKNAERVRRCIWPCPSESFRAVLSGAIFLVHIGLNSLIFAARVSSDNPRLKAFCRVAPSVLFKVPAIVAASPFFLQASSRYEHLSMSKFASAFSCFDLLDDPQNGVSVAVKKT